jgi:hypothetical protein
MILPVVGLYKAKGITAMLCAQRHANTKCAIAGVNVSSLLGSRRGFRRVRLMTAPKGPGVAAHALPIKRARRGAFRKHG